jgi:hypothetical protein
LFSSIGLYRVLLGIRPDLVHILARHVPLVTGTILGKYLALTIKPPLPLIEFLYLPPSFPAHSSASDIDHRDDHMKLFAGTLNV